VFRHLATALGAIFLTQGSVLAQDPPRSVLDSLVVSGPAVPRVPHEGISAIAAAEVLVQFLAESALLGSPGQVSPEHIRLTRLASPPVSGLQFWRADVSAVRTHWHPYLVVANDSTVIRFGGFTAPELLEISSYIVPDVVDERLARDFSMLYAQLADPNGAVELVFPDTDPQKPADYPIVKQWIDQRPSNWPLDHIARRSDGGFSIRLTVLSRAAHNPWAGWTALIYSFEFDPALRLQGWARQDGPGF